MQVNIKMSIYPPESWKPMTDDEIINLEMAMQDSQQRQEELVRMHNPEAYFAMQEERGKQAIELQRFKDRRFIGFE